MKKVMVVLVVLLMLGHHAVSAQTNAAAPPSSRVFYGGNVGFNISSDFWMINLSPLVGYQITPPLAGGLGLIYQYEHYSRPRRYNVHSYGGSVFLRYDLSANLMKELPFGLFFQTDYEGTQNRIRFKDDSLYNESVYIGRLLVGLGYIQPITSRSRFFVMISFDLLNMNNNQGIQPLIRGGFFF